MLRNDSKAFREAIESVAREIVVAEHREGWSYIKTPLLYPGGSTIVVRAEKPIAAIRLSWPAGLLRAQHGQRNSGLSPARSYLGLPQWVFRRGTNDSQFWVGMCFHRVHGDEGTGYLYRRQVRPRAGLLG